MKIEDLASSLREVEAVHGSDVVTLRSAVILAAKRYGRSRYALGKALTLYKQELPNGAWAPAVSLISKRLQLSDRTLREIMSGCRQTLPLPPNVIDELKRAGIDISEWLTSLSAFGAQPFPVMVVRVRGKEEFGVAGFAI